MRRRLPFTILSLLALLIVSPLMAQQRQAVDGPQVPLRFNHPQSSQIRVTNDTIFPTAFGLPCASTVTFYTITGQWGYLLGTNAFGDLEKAQRMDYSTNADVTVLEIWSYFPVATAVGDGTVQFNLYETTATSTPGTKLGETTPIRVSGLTVSDSALEVNIFPVVGNVVISGDSSFYASLDISALYATGDTVSLYCAPEDCGDSTSTYERWSDQNWYSFNDTNGWDLVTDILLDAVISFDETAASIDDYIRQGGLKIHPPYPNPAQELITLPYSLDRSAEVSLTLYDSQGRRLQQRQIGTMAPGEHEFSLHTAELPAGYYVYQLDAGNDRLLSRFTVQ